MWATSDVFPFVRYPSNSVTLGIHSLIAIFCGHSSSQVPQAMQALARSDSLRKT
jgi:hypothetical protein